MGYEPSGPFVTSIVELKLDPTTLFEWQKHSLSSTRVPPYQDLLEFINLRAQASEISISDKRQPKNDTASKKIPASGKIVMSFATGTSDPGFSSCVVCKTEKHPLYTCTKFKSLAHNPF